jgi:hypothetical protein
LSAGLLELAPRLHRLRVPPGGRRSAPGCPVYRVDRSVTDGDVLDFAGGARVVAAAADAFA